MSAVVPGPRPPPLFPVVVAGKTTGGGDDDGDDGAPDPNSPRSTIDTVAREIAAAGGAATAVRVDVRDPASVAALVATAAAAYGDDDGRLDAVVYNAGAVWWAAVEDTPLSRFRLLQDVNVHGLYATVQAALPHLRRRGRGRVVVVSPPIYSRFFRGKTAYAMVRNPPPAPPPLSLGALFSDRSRAGMCVHNPRLDGC